MSESRDSPSGEGQQAGRPGGEDHGFFSEQVQYAPVGARLPERVAPGVFATGAILLSGPEEFVIDFIQAATRPPRVTARVVMNARVFAQFVAALKDNLQKYEHNFGPPKPAPKPNVERRPTIREIYDDMKLPEELLSGVYANKALIGHTPADFFFDFITCFFPTAAVSARVYMSASQVPRVLETLSTSLQQYQQRRPSPAQDTPPDAQQR